MGEARKASERRGEWRMEEGVGVRWAGEVGPYRARDAVSEDWKSDDSGRMPMASSASDGVDPTLWVLGLRPEDRGGDGDCVVEKEDGNGRAAAAESRDAVVVVDRDRDARDGLFVLGWANLFVLGVVVRLVPLRGVRRGPRNLSDGVNDILTPDSKRAKPPNPR